MGAIRCLSPRARPILGAATGGGADMPVAWDALRVPGPPAGFELTLDEVAAADPLDRFHRRTIQRC
jgi:hypothetical protein